MYSISFSLFDLSDSFFTLHKDTFVATVKKFGSDAGVDFSRLAGCVKDKLKTRPASFSEKWLL